MASNGVPRKSAFDLRTCARPNILALKPYRCARDDYKDNGTNILLDANENAYGPSLSLSNDSKLSDTQLHLQGLNRYPDPHQTELKQLLCNLRNDPSRSAKPLTPDNLFVGVGSDEAIDLLIRCFCAPGRDKLLTCPPTYGMYAVSAQTNDVDIVQVPLLPSPTGASIGDDDKDDETDFRLDVPRISSTLTDHPEIKLIYLTSPGNPTASLLSHASILQLLHHPTWNGVIAIDEAYIDFAPPASTLAPLIPQYPNLVVLQTLSKAFGLAGIRLGTAFAPPAVARLLNNIKAPYNVNDITAQLALRALHPSAPHLAHMRHNVHQLRLQRARLVHQLPQIPGVGRFRGGFDANFLLVQLLDRPAGRPSSAVALRVYERLAERKGVVVRFRGKEMGCEGCVRVTVGTEHEVDRFLDDLRAVLAEIYAEGVRVDGGQVEVEVEERRREGEANAVVA